MEAKIMHAKPGAIALAALYILESLLLELEARAFLSEDDVQGLLSDAAKTLRAASGDFEKTYALPASEIVDAILAQHERISDGKSTVLRSVP